VGFLIQWAKTSTGKFLPNSQIKNFAIQPRNAMVKINSKLVLLFLIGLMAAAPAQTEKAALILHSGEEIDCQIKRISHGYVYFEAAGKRLTFKYGDFIEIEKVAAVRLSDGRTLTMNEYLAARGLSQPAEEPAPSRSRPAPRAESSPRDLPPPPSGPGVRLTNQGLEPAPRQNPIGLRLPELPPPPPSTEQNYAELANLLAEAGIAGKLLTEMNSGVLQGRVLTNSQKALVEAISQSAVWIARKSALREAQRVAEGEYNSLTFQELEVLSREFRFKPSGSRHAFEELVQFLHAQNAAHFQDKWAQVVTVFGDDAATALQDILNNYDDWYFLFGEAVEKR